MWVMAVGHDEEGERKLQCRAVPCGFSLSSGSWWLTLPVHFKAITEWGMKW